MGIPRNWCEEFIAEWLQMDGYLVETNVPVGTGSGGGRKEADVIGIRASGDELEIIHIEVGLISKGKGESVKNIRKKFESERINAVLARYNRLLGIKVNPKRYRKVFVASWASSGVFEELKRELGEEGIEILHLKELFNLVLRQVKDKVITPEGIRTLPESLWLLKIVEFLVVNKILPSNLLK